MIEKEPHTDLKRYLKTHRYGCIIFLLAMLVATPPTFKVESGHTVRAQDTQRDKEGQADEKKANRRVLSAGEVKGDPVLWKEPGKIANRDLFYGVGGKENAPDLSDVFTFMGQDKNGTSKKIYVRDSAGHEWIVKFGREARPETAATRIVWAVGYHVDPDYFVKSVHIEDGREASRPGT